MGGSWPNIFEISRSNRLGELVGGVAEYGGDLAGVVIRVDERRSLDAAAALPTDRERGIRVLRRLDRQDHSALSWIGCLIREKPAIELDPKMRQVAKVELCP